MANSLSSLLDPEYWKSVGETAPRSLGSLSQGIATGIAGAPVDIANMVLKPFGLGSENPVGGSNSLAQLIMANPQSPSYKIGQVLPVSPEMMVGAAKTIPLAMAGMMRSQFGRIAETGEETKSLADMLERAASAKGYNVKVERSAISPSKYITVSKPLDETEDITRQIRISNHADKYPELAEGIRYSTDPSTENTFEQAVNWLAKQGFPTSLSERYRSIPDYETYLAQQNEIRNSAQGKLQSLISAWRNLPKATRGPAPTLDDVMNGMTTIDLIRRK